MSSIIDDIRNTYKNGGALIRLIYVNSVAFIFFRLVFVGYLFSGNTLGFPCDFWFSLPASTSALLLKPWTLITYMFYHADIWHFLFNMLNLYWFGKIFLMYFDEKKLVSVYILGGILGGLAYYTVYNAIPSPYFSLASILMGASASIIALMTVTAIYVPNMKLMMAFFGEIKLIYIWIFSLIMFVILIASENPGGNIAHLGGALFGFLWIWFYRKGVDIAKWMTVLLAGIQKLFTRRRMKVTHRRPPVDDKEYNRARIANQAEIDRILDKISKGGYESLSSDEKQTLFKMSNQN